eukprot:tig00020911_g15747.t1
MATGFGNLRAFFERLSSGGGGSGSGGSRPPPKKSDEKVAPGRSVVVSGGGLEEMLDDGLLRMILKLIFKRLEPKDVKDVGRLVRVNRHFNELLSEPRFWEELINERFPETSPELISAYGDNMRNLYLSLALPRVHFAARDDMQVTWLDGNYLRRIEDVDLDHEVVKLQSVCWLELKGEMRKVLRGSYRASWRLKVEKRAVLDVVTFAVDLPSGAGTGAMRRWGEGEYGQVGGTGWFDLVVGTVRVDAPSTTLQYSLKAVEQMWWKSGISFDCFRLEPCA